MTQDRDDRDAAPARESDDPITPPAETHRAFVEQLQELDAVVWEMDAPTWRFTYVSPRAERVFGYPLSEWYDNPTFWQDVLLDPKDREWCVKFCSNATARCRNHAFLYRARTMDGSVIWIKDLVRVIPGEDGGAALMRGVMLDVTDEMARTTRLEMREVDYDAPEHAFLRRLLSSAA